MSRPFGYLATVGLGLAAFGVARLGYNLWGLRLLGEAGVGRVNVALAWALLLSLPVAAGLAASLSHQAPRLAADAARRALLRRVAVQAALATLAVLGLLAALRRALDLEPAIVLAAGAWSAAYGGAALARAHLLGAGRARAALVLDATGLVAAAGVAALAVLLELPRSIALWGPFSVFWLPGCLLLAVESARRGTAPGTSLRESWRFALWALAGSAAGIGMAQATTLLVDSRAGLAAAGRWAAIVSVLSPLLFVPRTLNAALFPRLAARSAPGATGYDAWCAWHQRVGATAALAALTPVVLLTPEIVRVVLPGPAEPVWTQAFVAAAVATWAVMRGEPLLTAAGAAGRMDLAALCAWVVVVPVVALWIAASGSDRLLLPIAWGWALYALAVPAVAAALAPRARAVGAYPRPRWLAVDAVPPILVAVALAGGGVAWRAAIAAVAACLAAHGLVRLRSELPAEPLLAAQGRLAASSSGA